MPDYSIRHYRQSDFDNYVRLRHEARKQVPIERLTGYISARFSNPNYTPEKDIFLVETDGRLIGHLDIMPEPGSRWVILSCWIDPGHRMKGLSRNLLSYAVERANELAAGELHVNVAESNEIAKIVLEKLGYKLARRYLDISLDMEKVAWQEIDRTKLDCRCLQPGEEEKLTRIQNRAFSDHWGFHPNTVQDIIYTINRGSNSHEDIIVTCDGDNFAGYCWTQIPFGGDIDDKKRGVIHMIGTDPAFRGTGAGRRVLLAGLMSLRERGVEVVTLTVDSENTAARALYESVGFEHRSSSLWYEKVIE